MIELMRKIKMPKDDDYKKLEKKHYPVTWDIVDGDILITDYHGVEVT